MTSQEFLDQVIVLEKIKMLIHDDVDNANDYIESQLSLLKEKRYKQLYSLAALSDHPWAKTKGSEYRQAKALLSPTLVATIDEMVSEIPISQPFQACLKGWHKECVRQKTDHLTVYCTCECHKINA